MENNFEISRRIKPLTNSNLKICNWRKHAFLENKKRNYKSLTWSGHCLFSEISR